jgi:hypothetical protein
LSSGFVQSFQGLKLLYPSLVSLNTNLSSFFIPEHFSISFAKLWSCNFILAYRIILAAVPATIGIV